MDSGEDYKIQFRLRHHTADDRWVLVRAVPVRDDDGAIVRWLGTATDIHEQRTAQDALERSGRALRDADQRKDEFLAMLAHELRNPLSDSTASTVMCRGSARVRGRRGDRAPGAQLTKWRDDARPYSRVTRGPREPEMEVVDSRRSSQRHRAGARVSTRAECIRKRLRRTMW